MSGIQEFNNKYIKRINNNLKDQPDYIKGFINNMTNSSLTTSQLDTIKSFLPYFTRLS